MRVADGARRARKELIRAAAMRIAIMVPMSGVFNTPDRR